jgi:hypothetical protein
MTDAFGQFHKHFMSAFAPILLRQKSSNLKFKHKKLRAKNSYKKAALKMLVKLRP